MLAAATSAIDAMARDIVRGRQSFLESLSPDELFSNYLGAPRFAVRAVLQGFTAGYRRPGDEQIIEALASQYSLVGKRIRCLEIGAGVTAQWSEDSDHQGAPWLSRYLALCHSDKFEIVASDIGRSINDDYLRMSLIHWPAGLEEEVAARTFSLWKADTSAALYNRLLDVFSSASGIGVALTGSRLGLHPEDFRPPAGARFPRFQESTSRENLIALPQIAPAAELSMFGLRFEEGFNITAPHNNLGRFDLIFGRHLGIAKHTLLNSIPKLAALLAPQGRIFLYTDYSPFTVLITYQDGKLQHSFPD